MVLCRTPALDGCAVDLFKFHPKKNKFHEEILSADVAVDSPAIIIDPGHLAKEISLWLARMPCDPGVWEF